MMIHALLARLGQTEPDGRVRLTLARTDGTELQLEVEAAPSAERAAARERRGGAQDSDAALSIPSGQLLLVRATPGPARALHAIQPLRG